MKICIGINKEKKQVMIIGSEKYKNKYKCDNYTTIDVLQPIPKVRQELMGWLINNGMSIKDAKITITNISNVILKALDK